MEAMSGDAARLPVDSAPRLGLRRSGDGRLAVLAAAGDRRAVEAIYRRYHQPIYRFCRAIVRDPDLAEDALQATMLKAGVALRGETRAIALKPWLFRIAHNEAINILRVRRDEAELDPELPASGPDPERSVSERDRLRQLVVDLDALPERQRGALVMRELSGLGFEEIGAAFGTSAAAAKQSVYEARVSLQEMVAGREMECDLVRQSISARDRRALRSRRIRSHLRHCQGCTAFAAAIEQRRADLDAIAPPLAVPAAAAALQGMLGAGGGAAAGSSVAGGAGAALGGSAAFKSTAAVIAAIAIAGGAADVGGLLDRDRSGDHRSPGPADTGAAHRSETGSSAASGTEAIGSQAITAGAARPGDGASSRARGHRGNGGRRAGEQLGTAHGGGAGASHPHAPSTPPAPAATPPGQAQTPPGLAHSNAGGGGGGSSGTNSGSQSVSHSNPQAAAQSSSSAHSQAGAAAHGGGNLTAPGQTGTGGNSATSNGHTGMTGKPDKPVE
jgi:RNA polymerase sigma factor (sigma-70 family)